MARDLPDFAHEERAFAAGSAWVVGIDEVGRGPLAGPVTAAAVRLDPHAIPVGLADSKQLSAAARTRLCEEIMATATVCVAHATVEEIDRLNILRAAQLAMERAARGFGRCPDHALVDGNQLPKDLPCAATGIVKGDVKCLSISAASIVAKVCRDKVMVDLAQHFPLYGWDRNAGYATPEHREALQKCGVTPHHRRSFRPVYNILYQEKTITA